MGFSKNFQGNSSKVTFSGIDVASSLKLQIREYLQLLLKEMSKKYSNINTFNEQFWNYKIQFSM